MSESEPSAPRIQDLPQEDRPRERLLRLGAEALSDAELMALFVGSGVKGSNAMQIAQQLIQVHGGLRALSRLTPAMLRKEKALGPARTALLAAAFELGKRAEQERLRELPLDAPERVYDYLGAELQQLSVESVRVLLLNTRLRLMRQEEISSGSVNESIAHPRDILRPVLAHQAHGFVLAHNHPSGDPSPSEADLRLTRRLRDAAQLMGVEFLDHVIVGTPSESRLQPYYSFREAGVL